MSPNQIQTFLTQQGGAVATMKVTEKSTTETLDYYPNYNKSVSVAQAIYDAAQVYGINPQVIMATMQKEQSLINDPDPTDSQLKFAMGFGCPDSAGCSDAKAGLFYQIDNGTFELRAHFERSSNNTWWGLAPSSYPCKSTTEFYSPGLFPGNKVSFYDGNGTKIATFTIANAATASLYCYTPHPYNNPQGINGVPKYGTTGSYYTGSYNFVGSFNKWHWSLSDYQNLVTPRWMQLTADTQKQYPGTDENVDTILPAGTQLFFRSKTLINGQWYLRTQYDTDHNFDKGIPLSQVEEIPFANATSAHWMTLTSDAQKVNPLTGKTKPGEFPDTLQVFIDSKIEIDGKWYLRTKYDTSQGNSWAFSISDLDEISYSSATRSHWMEITQDTKKVDPRTGSLSTQSLTAGTQLYVDSKILINGQLYLRATQDTQTNTSLAIPFGQINEIPYTNIASPSWQQLSQKLSKVDPRTGEQVGEPLSQYTQLKFASKVYINGQWYLRTQYDTDHSFNKGILESKVLNIPYANEATPYWVQLSSNAHKVDPLTGKTKSETFSKNLQILISSEITINGEQYYRTKYDTDNNNSWAFSASDVEAIPFVSLLNPRWLELTNTLQKLNPYTDVATGSELQANTSLFFDTKVFVNGQWYLRTRYDSEHNLIKGILLTDLNEISQSGT